MYVAVMYKLSLEDKGQLTGTSLSSLQEGQEGLREVSLIKSVQEKFKFPALGTRYILTNRGQLIQMFFERVVSAQGFSRFFV